MRFPHAARWFCRSTAAAILGAVTLIAPTARADDEVLRFAQTVYDMGAIDDSQTQLHAFSFVNTTSRIVRVGVGSCHFCAPPVLDKESFKPGESGTVVLEINPAGRKGSISASATLFEEGRPNPSVTVEFKAEVCPRVWVEPVNMFPRIVRGDGASTTFAVIGRKSDFRVLKIESDAALDGTEIGPPQEIDDCGSKARRQEVTIRFPREAPLGPWAARLKVITNDEQADPKLITVDGKVVGKVGFEPAVIGIRLAPGDSFLKTFEIVADGSDTGVEAGASGAVIIDSLDVLNRDEATGVALDFTPTMNPSRTRVTVSGTAPLRTRQAVQIKLEIVARTLGSPGSETIIVPITLVVSTSR